MNQQKNLLCYLGIAMVGWKECWHRVSEVTTFFMASFTQVGEYRTIRNNSEILVLHIEIVV